MIISSINPANTKIGFGTTQASETKATEQPTFIYDATELPNGYHWEHDLDNDTFVAVKNGYTFDEEKFAAVPVGKPYLPNLVEVKKTPADVTYEPENGEQPKTGYHWEHDLDNDKFLAVKDGYHLDSDGQAVED